MVIELIPVVEIGYNNQQVQVPDKYPYWENTVLWAAYRAASWHQAGFPDALATYGPGSAFCRLSAITEANLLKLVVDHTAGWRAGEYDREQASNLFGGYVLRVDGEDKFFPQCCGGLSDIIYWERLALGQHSAYEGHPAPGVVIEQDTLVLDFATQVDDEPFEPPPPTVTVRLSRAALQTAVANVQLELAHFAQLLARLNIAAGLGIAELAKLLIWQDDRHD
ncbi:hypothetical protein GCM10027422_16270 [Hymenobacter arcticus]